MAKKDFSATQIGAFLSADSKAPVKQNTPTEAKQKTTKKVEVIKTDKVVVPIKDNSIPTGYILAPEKKSKRLNLLIRPSVHTALDSMAKEQGTTINNLINDILAKAVEGK